MREELQQQSKQAREARETSQKQKNSEQKRVERLHREFRLEIYSKLELTEAQIAALEWFYEQPNIVENWQIYSALPKAYPASHKFLSALKYSKKSTADSDWIKTEALPDDDFDKLLEELPSLCHDHGVWVNRFKIEYDFKEERRKKRLRFWWSLIGVVVVLLFLIAQSN